MKMSWDKYVLLAVLDFCFCLSVACFLILSLSLKALQHPHLTMMMQSYKSRSCTPTCDATVNCMPIRMLTTCFPAPLPLLFIFINKDKAWQSAISATVTPWLEQSKIMAVPLSKDQTPHRSDEAQRCIQAGARILTMGQITNPNAPDDDSEFENPPLLLQRITRKKRKHTTSANKFDRRLFKIWKRWSVKNNNHRTAPWLRSRCNNDGFYHACWSMPKQNEVVGKQVQWENLPLKPIL